MPEPALSETTPADSDFARAERDSEEDSGVAEAAIAPSFPVDIQLERELEQMHIEFERVPDMSLDLIDRRGGAQVRLHPEKAPPENVERYVAQMAQYAIFPAIVVQADPGAPRERFFMVDGNTRFEAAKRLRYTTFPAYVLHARDFSTCREIGVLLNNRAGEALSKDETLRWVKEALSLGMPQARITRISGMSVKSVRKLEGNLKFAERVAQQKIEVPDRDINSTARAEIAQQLPQDSQFRAMTELARDSGMNAQEVKPILQAVRQAPSEQAGLDLIAQERTERAAQIEAHSRAIPSPRPPIAQQAVPHLAFVVNHSAEELFDLSPTTRARSEVLVRDALARLQATAGLYDARPLLPEIADDPTN
jgi:ParB-like chromosome segregation protein Spo0J